MNLPEWLALLLTLSGLAEAGLKWLAALKKAGFV
jgi:hypothetical protein